MHKCPRAPFRRSEKVPVLAKARKGKQIDRQMFSKLVRKTNKFVVRAGQGSKE